jgi:hypothetical protein
MPERSSRHVCKGGQGEREEINGILRKERGRVMMMMMIRSSRNIRAIEKIQLLYTFLFVYCRGGGLWGLKKVTCGHVCVRIDPSIYTYTRGASVCSVIHLVCLYLATLREEEGEEEGKKR